jgi:hypothetical protein
MNWRVILLGLLLIGVPTGIIVINFRPFGGNVVLGWQFVFLLLLFFFHFLFLSLPQLISRKNIERRWRKKLQEYWENDYKEYIADLHEKLSTCSIICDECKAPAKPILNSKDGYCCSKCKREFTDMEHNLIDEEEWLCRNPDPWDRQYPLSI